MNDAEALAAAVIEAKLVEQVERLKRQLNAVAALHCNDGYGYCRTCETERYGSVDYPCDTALVIESNK